MKRMLPLLWIVGFGLSSVLFHGLYASEPWLTGKIHFENLTSPGPIPEVYKLDAHEFSFELRSRRRLNGIGVELLDLRFPSPIRSPYPQNNTVVAEYYRPIGTGPFPAVIVLDILGGDQTLGRTQASVLAQNGIAALFVQMAYYGPRRPQGTSIRLISTDITHTMNGIQQTVLDVRRASAWLAAQPEVDAVRLGLVGTSLGSFMGSLTAEMEPRIKRLAIVLGGGGLVDAFYDHPQAMTIRSLYELFGGSKDALTKKVAVVDPITCACNLRDRRIIMFGAKRDEIVPPKATVRLWEELGKPKIVWYDTTHTGAAAYILDAIKQVIDFMKAP